MEAAETQRRGRGGIEFWRKEVEQCESSGKTAQEYCEDRGLKVKTYSHWRRRLKGVGQGFRAYEIAIGNQKAMYEVVLSNGRSVRLGSEFDVGVLKQLVSVLG